ncbi:hypothetical protein OIA45_48875 (plasmid) [Streptomyces chartreusis]|uniref:hypothetical protein n=1 Tax=Streptomyces chartreusis TaxID=1969 RepID=UPI0037DD81C9|nr:hypothetical protein OIA45_48875 [Streptomyces chartreusis]
MAITAAGPDTAPIQDPVSFEEAALLFMETGLPEFQSNLKTVTQKLTRWAHKDGLTIERRGRDRAHYVSYSDLLEAHNRRHPAPPRGGRRP